MQDQAGARSGGASALLLHGSLRPCRPLRLLGCVGRSPEAEAHIVQSARQNAEL